MQSPHVHFYIHSGLTLKKKEEFIEPISHPMPQIDPKSFNPLVVCTVSSKSTTAVVSPHSGGDSIFGNSIQVTIHYSAAAIVVSSTEKKDEPTAP